MDAPSDGAVAEKAGREGYLKEKGGASGADVEDISSGRDGGECCFDGVETGRWSLNMRGEVVVEKARRRCRVQNELAILPAVRD